MTKQTQLLADKLKQDPRLAEAKRLILETVAEHQQTIQSVRPPNPDLAQSYEEMLGEVQHSPQRSAFLRLPFQWIRERSVCGTG